MPLEILLLHTHIKSQQESPALRHPCTPNDTHPQKKQVANLIQNGELRTRVRSRGGMRQWWRAVVVLRGTGSCRQRARDQERAYGAQWEKETRRKLCWYWKNWRNAGRKILWWLRIVGARSQWMGKFPSRWLLANLSICPRVQTLLL